jgi:biopolymer transport protein ExbB
MKHGLSALDTIITMAPLLGILGTVFGIIRSFHVLGMDDIQSSAAVTRGVAESLINTAVGITVALLTLVPFNAFVSKVQRETRRLEQTIAQFETAYRKGTDHAPDDRLRV